jgi:hypothetical protein
MIVVFNSNNSVLAFVMISSKPGNLVSVTPEYPGAEDETLRDVLAKHNESGAVPLTHSIERYVKDLVDMLRGAGLKAAAAPDEARTALTRLNDPRYTAEIRADLIGEIINMSPAHLHELNADLAFS